MITDEYFIIEQRGKYLSKKFSFFEPRVEAWTSELRQARQYKTLGAARGQLTSLRQLSDYVNSTKATIKQVMSTVEIKDVV